MKIYNRALISMPDKKYIIIFLCISRRVHSIFMLRCFNDTIAMTFAYAGILYLLKEKRYLATILISLGISVKMNVLLFLPGSLLILSRSEGILRALTHVILMVVSQIVIGLPFILKFPSQYF